MAKIVVDNRMAVRYISTMHTTHYRFNRHKVQAMRELKGWSLREMGAVIRRTGRGYRLKEIGTSPFTAGEVCLLADAFGVSPLVFFEQVKGGVSCRKSPSQ